MPSKLSELTLGIDFGTSNSAAALVGPDGQMHTITLDGDRVVYRVAGNGPVLLLVHGLAGSATDDANGKRRFANLHGAVGLSNCAAGRMSVPA